jgi:hypothetical protein
LGGLLDAGVEVAVLAAGGSSCCLSFMIMVFRREVHFNLLAVRTKAEPGARSVGFKTRLLRETLHLSIVGVAPGISWRDVHSPGCRWVHNIFGRTSHAVSETLAHGTAHDAWYAGSTHMDESSRWQSDTAVTLAAAVAAEVGAGVTE